MGYNWHKKNMKKFILIIAALFAVTFAKAQITLENTYNSVLIITEYQGSPFTVYGDIYASFNFGTNTVDIIDANSLQIITTQTYSHWFIAAKGYFSSTNEVMILTEQNNHAVLLSQSGSIIQDLGENPVVSSGYGPMPSIKTLSDGSCKLNIVFQQNGTYITKLYSLPGNGVVTDLSEVSAPRNNARKYLHNDQVLIDSNNKTYNVQGQEVK